MRPDQPISYAVQCRIDPYLEDVWNKKVYKYLCDACHQLMVWEI